MSDNRCVLVCDDDEGILEMLSILLRMNGFTPIIQQKSTEVFESIKDAKPDLVILDLWMPILTGDQIARVLKTQDDTRLIPILAMSASDEGKNVAIQSGADDFLQKPFDVASFILKVRELIGENRSN